jgi:hypothetical protein
LNATNTQRLQIAVEGLGDILDQSLLDAVRVRLISCDKHVHVSGVSGLRMQRKGIPPDNEILDPMGIERREELFEVFGYFHIPFQA